MAKPRLIMKLSVSDIRREPGDVSIIEFRHPRRPQLPVFEPGSHVDIHLPGGKVRQYSLLGDPADRTRYIVGIKRETLGRGGSDWLHGNLSVGVEVPVSAPRNRFGLSTDARAHLLLAGGIGITPLFAMSRALRGKDEPFVLHYFTRSRSSAPMLRDLEADLPMENFVLHFDDDPQTRADLGELLRMPRDGQHLYYCGPPGFMAAVRSASAAWPKGTVHFEAFQPALDDNFKPEPFTLKLRSNGLEIEVAAEASALQMLRAAGVVLMSSCENGVCGSCECGYLAGDPIHRDAVLAEDVKDRRFIPCVSRAHGTLVLDL